MPKPLLEPLLSPSTTALVTQECQGGVVGAQSGLPYIAEEARKQAIPNIGRLLTAARAANVTVVHCLVQHLPGHRGSTNNSRLFQMGKSMNVDLSAGSAGASLLPEFGPAPDDLVSTRFHGLGPMAGTDLDTMLRNIGIKTIVCVGVSVNFAIPNFAMDAVNRGYDFVLPRDAVSGYPREWADTLIDNMLSLLATVTTTDAIVETWSGPSDQR